MRKPIERPQIRPDTYIVSPKHPEDLPTIVPPARILNATEAKLAKQNREKPCRSTDHAKGYRAGYNAGKRHGYKEGYDAASKTAYDTGLDVGIKRGIKQALDLVREQFDIVIVPKTES